VSEQQQQASVKVAVVKTTEPTFKPPPLVSIPKKEPLPQAGATVDTEQATKTIFAQLTPIQKEETTYWPADYLDFYKTLTPPHISKYEPLPKYEAPKKELIINVESTGAKPWESRIICIGVLDPNELEPQTINFIQEKEEDTLNEFLEWFSTTEYSVLVGYNVAFDYRYLYALMQRYRKSMPRWKEMELYDLMQQQKQVKTEYVFGYNPPGKLEEWATYLLGSQPYAQQEQVYKWWKEKNIEEIVNFNSDKLTKAYFLWVLDKLVSGTIPGTEVIARPSASETQTLPETQTSTQPEASKTIKVQCPNCLQEQEMLKTAKTTTCFVCGSTILNPAI